jgi:hypothetical protein
VDAPKTRTALIMPAGGCWWASRTLFVGSDLVVAWRRWVHAGLGLHGGAPAAHPSLADGLCPVRGLRAGCGFGPVAQLVRAHA